MQNEYDVLFKDLDSGRRYAVTQWEGEHNDILVEFKRMRLSENPDDDERMLHVQSVIDEILNCVCFETGNIVEIPYLKESTETVTVILLANDDIDDVELARWGEIFERQYYGYVTDDELVEAMNRLLNITGANTASNDFRESNIPLHS